MSLNSQVSLIRRLASIFYDALLLFSLLFFASFLALPLNGGEAIPSDNKLYPVLLFCGCYYYFVWQWIKGGQTLGMRAWRIRLVEDGRDRPSWKATSLRFFLSIVSWLLFGLGFLMAWFRADSKSLHDLYSHTYLVLEPKE